MDYGDVKQYFTQVISKRLSQVDVDATVSHQHELGGFALLRPMLGESDRRGIPATYTYLDDEGTTTERSHTSWYDARRKNPNRRPEWRLYYPDVEPLRLCHAGDLAVVATKPDDTLSFVFAKAGTNAESLVMWLFGLEESSRFKPSKDMSRHISAFSADLLEAMGVEVVLPPSMDQYVDEMLKRWPDKFPSGRDFSSFARNTTGLDPRDVGPDAALTAYYDRQTMLFMAYEQIDRERRLGPLVTDVHKPRYDDIMAMAMSLLQRRRSSAGHALENHLEAIFQGLGIEYSAQAITEGKKKPDFLFPSEEAYHDQSFPSAGLTMLGAKTTAKDRWRQVLSEADRIPRKHLITLEQAITTEQTDEMRADGLQLVVPKPLQGSYTDSQQEWLWSMGDFCQYVLDLQRRQL